ncbi:MAG: fluoride efflux transporter CrcB [Rhodospirillales bacterium]
MTPLAVAAGSALGGVLRYWCSGLIAARIGETFPWGTLIVNVVGSALIGIFAAVTAPDGRLLVAPEVRMFFTVGLLGGFTTFSSFSLQTLHLMRDGEWLFVAGNVVGSVVLCLVGVWLGYALGLLCTR